MAIGPPGASGRDELARVRAYVAANRLAPTEVVIVACQNGAGGLAAREAIDGSPVYAVSCIGHLHTSVIEVLLRAGAGGAPRPSVETPDSTMLFESPGEPGRPLSWRAACRPSPSSQPRTRAWASTSTCRSATASAPIATSRSQNGTWT